MFTPIIPAQLRADNGLVEGKRRRDQAHAALNTFRAALVRRLQRAFVRYLLEHGSATSDAVRDIIAIPSGTDARVVGAAIRGLVSLGIVTSVGMQLSRRPEAHARKLERWSIRDRTEALAWLARHPELIVPERTLFPLD